MALTEMWLGQDISDAELANHGYTIYRCAEVSKHEEVGNCYLLNLMLTVEFSI